MIKPASTLDLRGLKCPLPALYARRALERAGPGATIEILTDDPMAPVDVPHMCREAGYECLCVRASGPGHALLLRRPEAFAGSLPPEPPAA